ncbi:D-ribose pyranase [Halobacillus locisalis]|uniref:D-ribose pyranase n=1 Tax=Halobacillus locisalis TaxID=220753 RepID=A0A838CS96_9BACI|nr:D-ribose pyranase [Halobacillus locisalis]MBA2174821.1 D-ribose pyranase [Halobacillus locisalis]
MKKSGMLNREIASVLARLGHTDTIVIADCGLPIPEGVSCIDVSLTKGSPSFLEVLKAIEADMVIEKVTLAEEIKDYNKTVHTQLNFSDISYLSHEAFKEKTKQAKVIIRTGEVTPFANILLHAGVNF